MSTYQPGIPTGTVDLDVDYLNIQKNFTQLDTTFGVDHVTFSNQTPQNGYHAVIRFNPFSTTATNPPNNQPVAAPPTISGYGQLFSSQINDGINTDTALYFKTGGGRLQQLTRNFVPVGSGNGYTFLPGGLILQWGVVNSPGQSGSVAFNASNINFTSACFNVQMTIRRDGSTSAFGIYLNGAPTTTGFSYIGNGGSSNNAIYWVAIGK